MIYRHKHFNLNTKLRKVFDENNKELRLTGNAFRVLVFLCENEASTITDIGEYLDGAKDYDENHMRQYRYKINSIIGHDVVVYQNNIYSISGNIEKDDSVGRNTDLLQFNDIKLEDNNTIVEKDSNIKFSKIPAIIATIALLLTFIDWHSYGYYTIMKFIVTGTLAYYAFYIYTVLKKIDYWFWITVGIAILFNPIVPVYLKDKSTWLVIDVLVIVYIISLIFNLQKNEEDI